MASVARTSSVEYNTNKIGKRRVRPCPKGQVTVSEQILPLANPAHSGHSMHRTRDINWQYQAHTSRMTAPQKEHVSQWQACPEWDDDSREVTGLRVKVTVHLQARPER